jgi:UDP-glucose 4-epimerase
MNYLLLGGAGFIGQHLANKLIKEGHEVTIIDSLATSKRPSADCTFIHEDINQIDIEPYVIRSSIIYFLAGSVGVKHIVDNPHITTINNIALALKIIPLAAKHGKMVMFTSTSEVYGNGPFIETSDLSIGCSNNMRWSYASAKLTTEFMLASSGTPYKILRLFNVVGPGQLADYGMVLPRFIEAAKGDKDIVVYGDGNQSRSFCHVTDAVDYITQLEKAVDGTYNIGNDVAITINELAHKVKQLTNSQSSIVYKTIQNVFGKNGGDIYKRLPDLTKLKQSIFYRSNHSIEDIIAGMLYD